MTIRKAGAYVAFAVLAIAGLWLATERHSAPAFAEPRIVEASPQHADVLQTLPEFFHLCFSEPVKIEQSTDWRFNVRAPDGRSLGLRIVFDTAGECVDIYPGFPEPSPQGIWAFDWLVHAQSDGSEGSGVINFQFGDLQPGETPIATPEAAGSATDDDGDGGGISAVLLAAIGVGGVLIAAGGAGFLVRRRRAR